MLNQQTIDYVNDTAYQIVEFYNDEKDFFGENKANEYLKNQIDALTQYHAKESDCNELISALKDEINKRINNLTPTF